MKNNEEKRISFSGYLKGAIFNNKVIILFTVLCIACIMASNTSLNYIASEVFSRFGRNACLVLALIIPCLAGLGMNFGIVVGAIAAQIAIFFVVHWGFTGIGGFLLCTLMSTPMAIFFGWLLGILFNKTKGSEMITGLVLGFFADGLYRLFTLYIIGGLIPYDDPNLLDRGFGLRNAFDLSDSIKYALDDISFVTVFRLLMVFIIVIQLINIAIGSKKAMAVDKKESMLKLVSAAAGLVISFILMAVPGVSGMIGGTRLILSDTLRVAMIVYLLSLVIRKFLLHRDITKDRLIKGAVLTAIVLVLSYIPFIRDILRSVSISACTYGVICLFCFFNNWILDTKLGQDMRTVGQNRIVAGSAGINVDKIRIIATCISTVLAAWGQLIYLQNLGTFNTVQQQSNVGLYAVAALLVGGASVQKANNRQAIIGVVLFHTLFVVAPLAATQIIGDSAISEYIRMFICYGVIAVSLAMHAWKKKDKKVVKKIVGDDENKDVIKTLA